MATDARGEDRWVGKMLTRLRAHGFSIKQCRQGIVVKWPKHTTIHYGQTGVSGEMMERLCQEIRRVPEMLNAKEGA